MIKSIYKEKGDTMYTVGKEVIKQESDDYIYFTGENSEFLILTREEIEQYKNGIDVEMVEVSKTKYDKYLKGAYGFAGMGKIKENLKEFDRIEREILLEKEYKDIFFVEEGKILLLDKENNLVFFEDNKEEFIVSLDNKLNFEKGVEWHINRNHKYIALGEYMGQKALVIDIIEKKIELEIDRGDYHTKQMHFPLAFFEYDKVEYFAYGINWDRIKIIEVESKKLITPIEKEELDESIGSFWGRIIKHKDYLIADNWEWNPIGAIYSCRLEPWLTNGYLKDQDYDVIETAHYFWNRNITSYEDGIYIECIGRDDEELLAGLMIYKGENFEYLDFIFGPKNILAIDKGYLYSQVDKFEIWSIESKQLLFRGDKINLGRYSHKIGSFYRVEGNKVIIKQFLP